MYIVLLVAPLLTGTLPQVVSANEETLYEWRNVQQIRRIHLNTNSPDFLLGKKSCAGPALYVNKFVEKRDGTTGEIELHPALSEHMGRVKGVMTQASGEVVELKMYQALGMSIFVLFC